MDYESEMEKALSVIFINLKGIQENKVKQRPEFKVDISSDYCKSQFQESSPVKELRHSCSSSETTFSVPQQQNTIDCCNSMVPSLVAHDQLSENATSRENTTTPQTMKRSRKLPKAPVARR